MNITPLLLADLWRNFGHSGFPSEWDGVQGGGGKLSQRFWEYFKGIELLGLTEDSVVLDIGGGSPETGLGFFSQTIAPRVKAVHVLDVNFGDVSVFPPNVVCHRSLADYDTMLDLFRREPGITHIASLSVFEHIPQPVRVGIARAIDEAFRGDTFVATLEFHARERYMDQQLTTPTLSEVVRELKNFYPDAIDRSPVASQDAHARLFDFRSLCGLFGLGAMNRRKIYVPLWYPLALRFRRVPQEARENNAGK